MLTLSNLVLRAGTKDLLNNVNWQVLAGERHGLIGPNGAGKSTLLKAITGQRGADGGEIELQKSATIGYLEQETLEEDTDRSIREVAESAFDHILALEEEVHSISNELESRTDYESDDYMKWVDRLTLLNDQFSNTGFEKMETQIEKILLGLGFQRNDFERPLSEFSGGWRMRVALAKLLLKSPDLLLLDEPTNHLDIDSIGWLEEYISAYPGAVILVSHDQYFLDRMITHIAEIRGRSIYCFPGNFSKYQERREELLDLQTRRFEAQQREIAETEKFIERFRYKATKAKAVQSRIKQLDKVDRIEAPEDEQGEIGFRFPNSPRSGKVVLRIENLRKFYEKPDGSPLCVFDSNQELEIERGAKIALVGANGAGKSTLARIARGIEPFEGTRELGHNVHYSYFAQYLAEEMNANLTVLEEMEASATDSEGRQAVRTILGGFLFSGDEVLKKISVLSGGERSRLALAKTLLLKSNFLIFDEPTNHLDMASKSVLAQALKQFDGTLLVISHDRHFISEFAQTVWRVENGRVSIYDGGYDFYEWKHGQETSKDSLETDKKTKVNSVSSQGGSNVDYDKRKKEEKDRRKAENKLSRLEAELGALKREREKLEVEMAAPEFYLLDDHTQKLNHYEKLKAKEDALSGQWMELAEALE